MFRSVCSLPVLWMFAGLAWLAADLDPSTCGGAETPAPRSPHSATYYVDPAGRGGTPRSATFANLQGALHVAQPGDTILLRGGNYGLADVTSNGAEAVITRGGLPGAPLSIKAAPGEQPVIDLAEWYHNWRRKPSGWWYVDLPANSPTVAYPSCALVQIRNGWAASQILGSSADGVPPENFAHPPSQYMQGKQLAYDLTWYDSASHRLWFRSNDIEPITHPDTQCGIVSSASQFDAHAGWITLEGLQIRHAFFGMHLIGGTHAVVRNCRVTHCWMQGILIGDSYSELADNYVDAVGGQLTDMGGARGLRRDWRWHCLYLDEIQGCLVHDNFFGRALSGSSAIINNVAVAGPNATTVFRNNVCYGASGAALFIRGNNVTATGNVIISPSLLWHGAVPKDSGACWGIELLYPQDNITLSGNYVEGKGAGIVTNYVDSKFNGKTLPGWAVTGSTIIGGQFDMGFLTLPQVMGANQWQSPARFNLVNEAIDFPAFLRWAHSKGWEKATAARTVTPCDPAIVNRRLDANPGLDQSMATLRAYAAGQINAFGGSPAGGMQAAMLGGAATPDVNGLTPHAANDTYHFAPATTLAVDAARGVLANDSDPGGRRLAAALAAGPLHGQLTFNADGSFSYTPAPGFSGTDSFTYQVNNGQGGTSAATVTLVALADTGAVPVR
jgi:hypothetical protein